MIHLVYEKKITEYLQFEPTEDQKSLISKLAKFIAEYEKNDVFIIKGYAGTGKTTILSAVVKLLENNDIDNVLLAPTGRAAKVFSEYAGKQAVTIHKHIYKGSSSRGGKVKFSIRKNEFKNTFFIIDEASMISDKTENSIFGSGNLMDDLFRYVFSGKNCKIIFSGDTAQLPPVGLPYSPALDASRITGYGKNVEEYELTEVIRQAFDSGILFNATIIREMIAKNIQGETPKLKLNGFDDIVRLNGMDLIETISSSYSNAGIENTIVITRSNNRANRYNQGIRATVLYREDAFGADDRIMVVKNNYLWPIINKQVGFVANGDIAIVEQVKKTETEYGFDFADVSVYFQDTDMYLEAKVLLNTLTSTTASLEAEKSQELWEKIRDVYLQDYKPARVAYDKMREDVYLNALQIKFAYAVTCHKSQGGQWDEVFIDYSYVSELNTEYYRWLYTALTRAKKKIYLVNFPDDYFSNT